MLWTAWFDLDANTPWNPRWGIYQIRVVGPDGVPLQLPRVCAGDSNGTLYIGRSGYSTAKTSRCLGQRLWEFYSHGSHSGAGSYWQLKAVLARRQQWGHHRLQARVVELADNEIADAECAAIRLYFDEFGELPPCNSAFPGRWSTFEG
jgi:hypothetical protein